MADVYLGTPACSVGPIQRMKLKVHLREQQGFLWNWNYIVFCYWLVGWLVFTFTPARVCCKWPSEIARNNGNNRRERCTSFLSSRGNLGFLLHWHRLKQQYELHSSLKDQYCPPTISTVPCLLLWRSRTSQDSAASEVNARVLLGY